MTHSQNQDFWSQDRTTMHQKAGWFSKLPPLQKITYILLLLFIIGWCFYLGMTYALAIAPDIEWEIRDGFEWKKAMIEETGEQVVPLTGVEVALLVGADKRPEEASYRTDTILLAFYSWDSDELKLLSIPRDSYVQLPGKSIKTKINEAYAYGGMALLESVIEYTFGIEVDHCVEIDFHGFLELIDALGGVEIDVPRRMYKPTEEINIKAGLQVLNGYDALAFVRFRDLPMGDIDRIANQQMFIRALAAKISQSSIWKAPDLVRIGLANTNTNYQFTEALQLGGALYKTDLLNIPMYSLPGRGVYLLKGKNWISFWILNKKDTIDIISEITAGVVGDFHIIGDEGKGLDKAPVPEEQEETGEEIPEEGAEGAGEETPPEPPDNEETGEGQDGEGADAAGNGQEPPEQQLPAEALPEPDVTLQPPQPTEQQYQLAYSQAPEWPLDTAKGLAGPAKNSAAFLCVS